MIYHSVKDSFYQAGILVEIQNFSELKNLTSNAKIRSSLKVSLKRYIEVQACLVSSPDR